MIKMPGRALACAATAALLLGLPGSAGPRNHNDRQQVQAGRFDILIRGGSVVDGTGSAARRADILVRGDRIVAIDDIDPASVEVGRVIDAGCFGLSTGLEYRPGYFAKVVYGHGRERAEQVLALMQAGREKGIRITADIYPYNASYTGIGIVFPGWALPPNDYSEVVENRRDELAGYLRSRVAMRNGPEATLFATRRLKPSPTCSRPVSTGLS